MDCYRIILTAILLFISGCSQRQQILKKNSVVNHDMCCETISDINDMVTMVNEQEAKLIDIPIPLNVIPIPFYFMKNSSECGTTLGYESTSNAEELLPFFTQEMERLGWKMRALSTTSESLMYCEKPTRFCAISLRPLDQEKISIVITTGKKAD